MSFMFHPYPCAEPSVVSEIEVPAAVREERTVGIIGRQIGNAVPVLLAQAVGRALIQMEDHYRNHGNG